MSESSNPTMHINLFIHEMGHHEAAWRLPSARPKAVVDLEHYRHAVSIAEGAKFDYLADRPDRDRLDRLSGPLQPGAAIRHARLSLEWPGGLEHRHLRPPG
jgi:hypothetical protein